MTARALAPVSHEEVAAARARIAGTVLRTPLVRLHVNAPAEIYLKLECLQPIGSFKLRGATNALRKLAAEAPDRLSDGVYTASAGNMAQGVAWGARTLGIPCTVFVPETAPQTKLAAIERLGASIVKRPFDEWWRIIRDHGDPEMRATFVHPFADPDVMAGNGTIAFEILEDLPETDAIVVPYGGGGLACGIAAALADGGATRTRPRVFACEVETAAPLAASLRAGAPTPAAYAPSFIDGIGAKNIADEMWPLASSLLERSLLVSPAAIAEAVRLIAERARVIAEGAGAAAVAAALSGEAGTGKVVCVVSGGNIDASKLCVILQGGVPPAVPR
jgi:threonine dehydratase